MNAVFSVMHWNVQGIHDKIDEILLVNNLLDLDVIGICEHWLNQDNLSDVFIPGFKLASSFCRTAYRGGTALYLKSNLICEEVNYIINFSVPYVCEIAAILIPYVNVICVEIYRTPYDENFNKFIDCLFNVLNVVSLKNRTNASVVICGDFNVDININDFKKLTLDNLFLSFNLKYTVSDVTRPSLSDNNAGSCIDNIVTSIHPCRFSASVEPMAVSDHHAIIFRCILSTIDKVNGCNKQCPGMKNIIRPIINHNIANFLYLVSTINWMSLCNSNLTVNAKFELFLKLFLSIVDDVFPIKFVRKNNTCLKKKTLKWYNLQLKNKKDKCISKYLEYKNGGDLKSKEECRVLRNEYKKNIIETKLNYNNNRVINANKNSKAIWSIVNDTLNKNESSFETPTNLSCNGFNEFFVNSVQMIINNVPKSNNSAYHYLCKSKLQCYNKFSFNNISVEHVSMAINSLSNSTSLDIYGMNSSIMKMASSFIDEVLSYLFNICVNSGIYPKCLKLVKVVPIFKKGSKGEYNNYRPISIIPVISKVFEIIINKQIIDYFESNNLFSDAQFGFRSNRGTSTAVAKFMKECMYSLEEKCIVNSCFYDMSKAFDTISHEILLKKLKFYGFDSVTVDFLTSYFTDRYQCVFYKGEFSSLLSVNTGVQQGSIMGPTMFDIYVNDLPELLSNNSIATYMYADDLAIQIKGKTNNLICEVLNTTNILIDDWTSANLLSLNKDKTQIMEFSLDRKSIVNSVKFLGICLQSNIKWNRHILSIRKKITKGLFMLIRLRKIVSLEVLVSVYFAHIHSHLSYCTFVWGNDFHINMLLILQKKAIRIILKVNSRTHCKPLFKQLRIMTVHSVFIFQCLVYIKVNLTDISTYLDIHNRNTRFKDNLTLSFCRYETTKNSFCEIGKKLYNHLPTYVKYLPLQKFKKEVKQILLDMSVYSFNEFIDAFK